MVYFANLHDCKAYIPEMALEGAGAAAAFFQFTSQLNDVVHLVKIASWTLRGYQKANRRA